MVSNLDYVLQFKWCCLVCSNCFCTLVFKQNRKGTVLDSMSVLFSLFFLIVVMVEASDMELVQNISTSGVCYVQNLCTESINSCVVLLGCI